MTNTIQIPDGAIRVDLNNGLDCPHCKNPLKPEVLDYFHQEMENPDKWFYIRIFALFQCVACKGLYYIDHSERNES